MAQFQDHLADDVLPPLLDKLSSIKQSTNPQFSTRLACRKNLELHGKIIDSDKDRPGIPQAAKGFEPGL